MNIYKQIDNLQQKINNIRPLPEAQIVELRKYYKIGLTYSSNAMEGNTLTESETRAIIEDGITIGGKALSYHLEAVGHAKAFDKIYKLSKKDTIIEEDIKYLHKLFYSSIDLEQAGFYRNVRVFISGSEYLFPRPEEINSLMKNFVEKYNNILSKKHPVEIAAQIHKDFVYVHPFIDGNGRIARLLMNIILIKNKFPITIIPPVLRMEYINLLEKAHKNDKDFIFFIAQRVEQAQLDFLRLFSN